MENLQTKILYLKLFYIGKGSEKISYRLKFWAGAISCVMMPPPK